VTPELAEEMGRARAVIRLVRMKVGRVRSKNRTDIQVVTELDALPSPPHVPAQMRGQKHTLIGWLNRLPEGGVQAYLTEGDVPPIDRLYVVSQQTNYVMQTGKQHLMQYWVFELDDG
jgi:hypothetical protein